MLSIVASLVAVLAVTSSSAQHPGIDHCRIARHQRVYIDVGGSQDQCEANAGCFDPQASADGDQASACYLRDNDECYVRFDERASIAVSNSTACEAIGACWDQYASELQKRCYFKAAEEHCRQRPWNCELEEQSSCVYREGQTCGVGHMTETWICYYSDDDAVTHDDDDDEDYFTVEVGRLCCREQCPPGDGTKTPLITCRDVVPKCEEKSSSQKGSSSKNN